MLPRRRRYTRTAVSDDNLFTVPVALCCYLYRPASGGVLDRIVDHIGDSLKKQISITARVQIVCESRLDVLTSFLGQRFI